jgi:hypothetical protein
VSEGLRVGRAEPNLVGLGLVVLLFIELDLRVVRLAAVLEVFGLEASPRFAEVRQVIDEYFRAVPELHRVEDFQNHAFCFPAQACANLELLVHNEREEQVGLELIDIEGHLVHNQVLDEQCRDDVCLQINER